MNRKNIKVTFKKGIIGLLILFILYLIIPLPSPLFKTDYSRVVTDENGEYLRVFLNSNEQWIFPPSETDRIPEKLKIAVINYEDSYFKWHWGFNPVSIVRAAYQNISEGKIVSGASTITMQVARLMNPKPRTIINKILEILLAVKIEFHYSKDNILKAYLGHAPFGGNIRGYKAAALKYFQKSPKGLSWAEAAALAVLPNAPGLVTPFSRNKLLRQKRDKLLKKLYKHKIIDHSTYKLSLLEPIISKVYPFQITAPQFTERAINQNKKDFLIKTTLNIELQQYLEFMVKQYSSELQRQGIKNCAAIVLETKTGKVKAYIGSQDYFDIKNQGMIDGIIANRSSGSVLKPFLYALSIDDGIVIPQTLIKDIPSYFNGYSPQNFDSEFSGIISSKEALIRSLNVPAVRLLNTYGIFKFYSFLKAAGLTTLFRSAEDYGLPLIIGGAEVNLFDMTMLFRGLANGGVFQKSYFIEKDSLKNRSKTSQLISPGACYLTLKMLKDLRRPGTDNFWRRFQNQKPIAWKTGTSYGAKDAWAIGVSPKWTIGVWAGNFDAEPNSNLTGVGSAAPLLFEIFNYLTADEQNKWFEKADIDFKSVTICKETGFLAGPYCDEKENVDVPFNMAPLKICPYHKNIFIDPKTGYEVCSYCWGKNHLEKHVLVFPSDVNYYLRKRGQIVETIPPHNPKCTIQTDNNPIDILYPIEMTKILLPREFNGKQEKLIAKVAANRQNDKIFWYIDNTYLGTTQSRHEKSIALSKGWHHLSVIDEDGFSDKVRFFVNVK